jgi:signal transduction histidine kinase
MLRLPLRLALVACVAGALALGVQGYGHSIRHDVEAPFRRDLRHLEALDARLDRELLRSRAGLVMHYDDLTSAFRELRRTARRMARVPELGFDPGPELGSALARIAELIREQELNLELFKSVNAILRNSRQYYPALLDEVRSSLEKTPNGELLAPRLTAVTGALAHLDAAPANDAVALLADALTALESASRSAALPQLALSDASPPKPAPPAGSSRMFAVPATAVQASPREEIELVLQHGRIIVDHFANVDRLVARVLAIPLADENARATAGYEQSYAAALRRGQLHVTLLTALIGLAIVLGLVEVIARARAGARALGRAKDELERANRALDRERQREHQQNELKTRFVSATSHEFRTPLTTILSSSQMLATYGERWDAARRMTHFERIITAAQHMAEMLEEILLIGRAEMGVLAAQPVELDLHEYLKSLIETLARAAGRPGAIELSVSGQAKAQLDRRLLTHVLGNLLENALKYSDPGSKVALRLSVEHGGVRFEVNDSGVGIPEHDLPHLFDSFYRGQNVGATAGSGLGLAVVKRAVDVQGGSIDVKSERGRGTSVEVWLPLEPNAALGSERAPADVAAGAPASSPMSSLRSEIRNA